jgi:hypothetical protein
MEVAESLSFHGILDRHRIAERCFPDRGFFKSNGAIGISPILEVKEELDRQRTAGRHARAHRNELARATLKGQA